MTTNTKNAQSLQSTDFKFIAPLQMTPLLLPQPLKTSPMAKAKERFLPTHGLTFVLTMKFFSILTH